MGSFLVYIVQRSKGKVKSGYTCSGYEDPKRMNSSMPAKKDKVQSNIYNPQNLLKIVEKFPKERKHKITKQHE